MSQQLWQQMRSKGLFVTSLVGGKCLKSHRFSSRRKISRLKVQRHRPNVAGAADPPLSQTPTFINGVHCADKVCRLCAEDSARAWAKSWSQYLLVWPPVPLISSGKSLKMNSVIVGFKVTFCSYVSVELFAIEDKLRILFGLNLTKYYNLCNIYASA